MSRPGSGPRVGPPFSTAVRFGPADVGRRLTVRRRLAEPAADGAELSDVVGVLESWVDGVLTLRRRTGEKVRVAADSVVAGRVVAPELSAADAALAELENRLGAAAVASAERLGDWVVHLDPTAAGGSTVLAAGDPGGTVEQALQLVRARCASAAVRPAVTVVLPSTIADEALAHGWQEVARLAVRTPPPRLPARPSRRDLVPGNVFHVAEVSGPVEGDPSDGDGSVLHHVQAVLLPPD